VRVVVACDWFLKYATAQSAALARAGASVMLLCRAHAHEFGGDERERQAALDGARAAGVCVVEAPGRLSDPRALAAWPSIAARLRRFAPQVVHAHDGADPRAQAALAGRPTVLTIHDPVPHPGQPLAAVRKRWLLHGSRDAWRARARVIVVHSEVLRSSVGLGAGQSCAVIPHGMDVAARPLPAPAHPALGFFGRLVPYKGLDVLARAMPLVWQRRPETRLRVAGAGEQPLELEDRRVHIERRYLPEADIPAFFGAASLTVLPYTQASQTGVGSQAVGFGVPVVVSRLGGLPDLTLDTSYVVAPGDPEALASALVRHLDDGAEVRTRVLEHVARPRGWAAVADRALSLYEQVVSPR
jgi:glycosyltransferase involved in cell wall biosynthesis